MKEIIALVVVVIALYGLIPLIDFTILKYEYMKFKEITDIEFETGNG